MPVLFRRDVPVQRVLVVTARQARALQAPIRLAILDLLATRTLSIEELAEELIDHGFSKASNTLRHHVEILRKAGLIDLALLEQSRGAVLKSYAATAWPVYLEYPEDLDPDLEALVGKIRPTVQGALTSLTKGDANRLRRIAERIRPCEHCPTDHYVESVLLEVLHRTCRDILRGASTEHPARPATGGRRRLPRVGPPT